MTEFHDLNGSQVLGCLWLWASLVSGYKEKYCVHDRGTVKHCGHEDVVAWAVDERDVTQEFKGASAVGPFAREGVVFVATCGFVAGWTGAFWVVAFEDLEGIVSVNNLFLF